MNKLFDHEHLRVYQSSIEFVAWLEGLYPEIDRKVSAHDHLVRASASVPVNIAEASGKFSMNERRQFVDTAYGSSLECSACLDVLCILACISPAMAQTGKGQLYAIVSIWCDELRRAKVVARPVETTLDRTSTAMALNIAEGNGKFSTKDRCRFIEHARTAALQAAASLDIVAVRRSPLKRKAAEGKALLSDSVRMLVAWQRSISGEYPETDRHFGQEGTLVGLSGGRLLCVFRSRLGHPFYSISANRGAMWSKPEVLRLSPGGEPFNQPCAPCPISKLPDGRFVFLFHNVKPEGGGWYPRDPLWIAVVRETPGVTENAGLYFSKPKVVIYNDGVPGGPFKDFEIIITVHRDYGAPEIVITENGIAQEDQLDTDGRIRDTYRRDYLAAHLEQIGNALADGAKVRGYCCWSLLDNFEWDMGWGQRFGLIHVDYQTLKRTVKESGWWYRDFIGQQGRKNHV